MPAAYTMYVCVYILPKGEMNNVFPAAPTSAHPAISILELHFLLITTKYPIQHPIYCIKNSGISYHNEFQNIYGGRFLKLY